MGWFSKTIPERKWTDVSAALFQKLKGTRDSWYPTFQRESQSHGFALASDGPSRVATHYVNLLQLSAVAATLQDNGYVSDPVFFLELVYIMMSGNQPAQLHRDIAATPFSLAGNAQESLTLWAQSMAGELSPSNGSQRLVDELKPYGAFIVAQAKIATCEACGDQNGAEKTRRFLANE